MEKAERIVYSNSGNLEVVRQILFILTITTGVFLAFRYLAEVSWVVAAFPAWITGCVFDSISLTGFEMVTKNPPNQFWQTVRRLLKSILALGAGFIFYYFIVWAIQAVFFPGAPYPPRNFFESCLVVILLTSVFILMTGYLLSALRFWRNPMMPTKSAPPPDNNNTKLELKLN